MYDYDSQIIEISIRNNEYNNEIIPSMINIIEKKRLIIGRFTTWNQFIDFENIFALKI